MAVILTIVQTILIVSLVAVSQADIKGCAIHMTILVLNDELAKKIASGITECTVLYSWTAQF